MKKYRYYTYIVLLFIAFIAIYIFSINYTINKQDYKFMYRAWSWLEYLLGVFALVVIIKKYKEIKLRYIILGIVLAGISFLSMYFRSDIQTAVIGKIITLLAFIAGCLLSDSSYKNKSILIIRDYKALPKAVLTGVLIALPFAIANYIYFRLTIGPVETMNIFRAAFLALEPGISEEIIFRYFIMNAMFSLLVNKINTKHMIFISFFFGIVPHSLIHFSELWITNIPAAIFMLLTTSLLFGLPMAYLQYKKDLETAITFHWFIDFIRFVGGY